MTFAVTGRWETRDDGRTFFVTPGVDWGGRDGYPQLLARRGDYVVVRSKGSTQWDGVGQTAYFPTLYWVARMKEATRPSSARSTLCLVPVTEEHKPGRRWRRCLTELTNKAEELAANDAEEGS